MNNAILKALATAGIAVFAASSAFAGGHGSVTVGGETRFTIQDRDNADRTSFNSSRTKITVNASFEDESGLKYGQKTSIVSSGGSVSGDSHKLYVGGDFGTFNLGRMASQADNRINAAGGTDVGGILGIANAGFSGGTKSQSISYSSPSFSGLTFGISYAPTSTRVARTITAATNLHTYGVVSSSAGAGSDPSESNGGLYLGTVSSTTSLGSVVSGSAIDLGTTGDTGGIADAADNVRLALINTRETSAAVTSDYEDEIAINLAYSADLGGASVNIAYSMEQASFDNRPGTTQWEDAHVWNLGAAVGVGDFTIKASTYDNGDTGTAKGSAGDGGSGMAVGAYYNYGAGDLGFSYEDSEQKHGDGDKDTASTWRLSATYTIAKGLKGSLAYSDQEEKNKEGNTTTTTTDSAIGARIKLGF